MGGAGLVDENGEPLTPTSAWRAAKKLAKVAIMKKSMNRVSDFNNSDFWEINKYKKAMFIRKKKKKKKVALVFGGWMI